MINHKQLNSLEINSLIADAYKKIAELPYHNDIKEKFNDEFHSIIESSKVKSHSVFKQNINNFVDQKQDLILTPAQNDMLDKVQYNFIPEPVQFYDESKQCHDRFLKRRKI